MTIRKAWWLTRLLLTISAVCAGLAICPAAGTAQQPVAVGDGTYRVSVGGTTPGVPGSWYPAPAAMAPGGMAYGPAWNTVAPAAYQSGPQYVEVAPGLYKPAVETPAAGPMLESEDAGEYCSAAPVHGFLGNFLRWLAPYSDGGCAEPRWFDVHAEALFLNLDQNLPFIVFSRDTSGIDQMTSNDLGSGERAGVRVSLVCQTGPGSNLEFTYLGMFDYTGTGSATGTGNLNSIFSDFTLLNPPNGLEQFDRADHHQVDLNNDFDSLELNYRRRWQGPGCMFQGSWLVGARYAKVKDNLTWLSLVPSADPALPNGEGHYTVTATNYMPGGQIGGDLWVCLVPGVHVGIEGKAALLGNNVKQKTDIWSIDPVNGFTGLLPTEEIRAHKVAGLGECNIMATWRLNPKLTFRAGYSMVRLEGVATGIDNFNPDIPTLTTRTPFLSDGGQLTYRGFTVGGEWMW